MWPEDCGNDFRIKDSMTQGQAVIISNLSECSLWKTVEDDGAVASEGDFGNVGLCRYGEDLVGFYQCPVTTAW